MTIDLTRVRGILSDMDGVWFVGDELVAGAADALARVREHEIPIRFITNTTTRTHEQIATRMAAMGLAIPPEEIINSPRAAALYLRRRGRPSLHCIVADEVRETFSEFPASREPEVVVVGDIGGGWNYPIMNEAFRMLIGGAELVAMHKGRYWQVEDGLALDIGAFVAGLEYATGKTATIVGKPSPTIFASALDSIGLDANQVVMVGDDIHSDVGGAQQAGIPGVLVRTGKFREELVAQSGVAPAMTVDDIGELIRAL